MLTSLVSETDLRRGRMGHVDFVAAQHHQHRADGRAVVVLLSHANRWRELAARLDEQLRARNLQGAWQLVKDTHTYAIESAVVAAGLIALRNGAHAATEAMLSVKARMRPALDANLSILATIGSNAPFVGLLGTVLGIIKAAHELTAETAPEQSECGNVRRVRGPRCDGRRAVRRHSGGRCLQFVSTDACGSGLPKSIRWHT